MTMAKPKILFDNRLSDAIPVASSTDTDFDVNNLFDWRPYTWWSPSALPATVTVDCGAAAAADYALIWGHDLFSCSCDIEIHGSTDNFSSSDVTVATHSPTDDNPFIIQFNSVSYRYWRIVITASTSIPKIAIAAIGAAMQFDNGVELGIDPLQRTIIGQLNRSEDGNPLGRAIDFEDWSATLTFPAVAWAWLRSTFMPAWKSHLRSTPFVFAWEPGDHADEIYLVQSGDKLSAPHDNPLTCTLSFDIIGLAL